MDTDNTQPSSAAGVDQDGTPNVFDQLMTQAKQGQPMSVAITEPHSMHWLLEREIASLPAYLKSIDTSHRYLPRLGEIVLIVRNLKPKQTVKYDEQAEIYKIEDERLGYVGLPQWEAAVVTQVDGRASTAALLDQSSSADDSSANSFRVEPMSQAGNSNKAWSTRYKNVNHLHMRPFSLWQELLKGADVDDPRECHPTVRNALAAMSSLSTVDRFHFSSTGSEARVYCKGFYLGAEFILKNDLVRFDSQLHNDSSGKNVVLIKHVYMSYNLAKEDAVGGLHVEGVAYTTDPRHASGQYQKPIPEDSLPSTIMRDYGLWYKMSEDNSLIRVPLTNLLTRLVEGKYMSAVIGKHTLTKVAYGNGALALGFKEHIVDMTFGLEGVRAARKYSTQHDARINRRKGETWYLGEDRVAQLDLHLLNDQDVGDKATFGFESNPTPLQESDLKAMFRARATRQKGPNKGVSYTQPAPYFAGDFATQEQIDNVQHGVDFVEQGLDKYSNLKAMDMFENEFTKRVADDDWQQYMN